MLKKTVVVLLLLIAVLAIVIGVDSLRSHSYKNQVAVLTYHHVDPEESEFTISAERFRDHLAALKEHGFHVITMDEFIGFLKDAKPVPDNAVVITFDDGYESFYQYAYPELKKQGMSATQFLIVSSVGKKDEQPPFLSWDEIKEMRQSGIDFYSHTFDSHDFRPGDKGKSANSLTSRLLLPDSNRVETDEEYRQRVLADLSEAEKQLRGQLGNKLGLLCLPHGRYHRELIDLAGQAGINYIFTGDYGLNSSKDKLIKRITAGVPTLTGEQLVSKIEKETTLLGKAEDVAKNTLLQIRYKFF
ncbi:polysaccharide deacetylase family protein [Paenibacillus thalictri]|nr:polysaccharide deacetylase family protein [Paenibacillus thalictri]